MKDLNDKFIDLFSYICTLEKHDGILLSGGLDSSIIAYHIEPLNAITIVIDKNSPDYYYSSLLYKKNFFKNHHIIFIDYNEIIYNIEELVRDFKSFDPIFLKNSVVQLIGFKKAKELNIKSLAIGDGADELFAGYNFFHKYIHEPKTIAQKIEYVKENMDFVSQTFSKNFNVNLFLPFINQNIIDFSNKLKLDDKISSYKGKYFGKFFLRKCYEKLLGKEIVWRKKTALENGSGVTNVKNYIENYLATDLEYQKEIKRIKLEEKVELRDREHLFFYRLFRKYFTEPIKNDIIGVEGGENTKKCPSCNTNFIWKGNFCKVCGAFPV